MKAERLQKMAIGTDSECKHNKWQLSYVVPLMQMVAFPLHITSFRLLVQPHNELYC